MADYSSIAQNMAFNHIILPCDSEEKISIFDTYLKRNSEFDLEKISKAKRVILVIGAGASKAVGLPLGTDTFKLISDRLNIGQKFLNYELDRLENVFRLRRDEFETQLLAFSKFQPFELRNILKEIFYHKYFPCLHYEIIAHLFRHRFIDAIINFNFDEILDQAIIDEMEHASYHKIISDGDFPDDISKMKINTFNNQTRFKHPLYIKPHGTVNHKSTMRFTREDYFSISEDIQQIISELFKEDYILISVGFNMESFEFNKILANSKIKMSELYLTRPKKFNVKKLDDLIKPIYKDCFMVKGDNNPDQLLSKNIGLNEVMINIFKEAVDQFNSNHKPKDIERHMLICDLFSRETPSNFNGYILENKLDLRIYFLARTKVEILLTIIKAKGFIVIDQLKNGRAGKYYNYYRNTFENSNSGLLSFIKICQDIHLYKSGYSLDTYSLRENGNASAKKKNKSFEEVIIRPEEFEKVHLERIMRDIESQSLNENFDITLYREFLLKRFKGIEVKIIPLKENSFDHLFHKYKSINSLISLQFNTIKLLEDPYWNILMVVAETGEWLTADHIFKIFENRIRQGKLFKILLIVADMVCKDDIQNKFNSLGNKDLVEIEFIPWWLHNQHLTMTFYNKKPMSGMYFERRLRSQNVSPILIENTEECEKLVDVFFSYYLKSEFLKKEKFYSEITHKEVKNIAESKIDKIVKELANCKI